MQDYSSLNSGPITGARIAKELVDHIDAASGRAVTVAELRHGPQVYNLMHAMGFGNRVTVDEAMEVIKAWNTGKRASRSTLDSAAEAEFKAAVAKLNAQ